jgi:hypothetical protein
MMSRIIARLRETEWSDEVTRQTGRGWTEDIPGGSVARPLTNRGGFYSSSWAIFFLNFLKSGRRYSRRLTPTWSSFVLIVSRGNGP